MFPPHSRRILETTRLELLVEVGPEKGKERQKLKINCFSILPFVDTDTEARENATDKKNGNLMFSI